MRQLMTPLTTRHVTGYTELEDPITCHIEQKIMSCQKWLDTAHRLGSIAINIFIALPLICFAGPALPLLLPGIVCSLITIQCLVNAQNILSFFPVFLMGGLSGVACGVAIQIYVTWIKDFILTTPFLPTILLGSTIVLGTLLCTKGMCLAIEKYCSWKIQSHRELLRQIAQMKSNPAYQPPPNVRESLNLRIKELFTLPFCHGKIRFIPSLIEQLLVQLNPEKA